MTAFEQSLVSVVIPTCDRRDTLARCLNALTQQTHRNLEIIVVDDCSADGTPAFLRAFAQDHPELRLRVLRNERHAGANPSRNRGTLAARGEFVAFIDSDCITEPDWVEKLMRGFCSERVAAVTGLVVDHAPRSIYELAFKGTHRLHRAGPAHRLVGGNMCVRRNALMKYRFDEDDDQADTNRDGRPDIDVSGRCDEEGLFLRLRAAGYEQLVVPEAIVLHDHPFTARSFFRAAYGKGGAAARLVYKYYLPPRLDLLPLLFAYLTLPLVLMDSRLAVIPLACFSAAIAAYGYNDLFRKGKTLGETVKTFPLLLVYYHLRLCGYVFEALRLRLTRHDLTRVRLERSHRNSAAIPRGAKGDEMSRG